MAEAKNNFLKSKMNQDLDDRLVPIGEYRSAQNVSIAKSEGQDVGALENILGNDLVSTFTLPANTYNVEIIGYCMDIQHDRIIVFMTNYVDTSSDTLSNFSPSGAYHGIGVYNINTTVSNVIVTGRFLNFSKTHEIYGVNVLDDLLFWTDNRNQPRKINLSQSSGYYTTEDHISVSKYYPYQTIDLIKDEVIGSSLSAAGSGYAVANNVPTTPNFPSVGTGLTINILTLGGGNSILSFEINNPGIGYATGDTVTVNAGGGDAIILLTIETSSTMQDVVSDYLPDGTTPNPYRQPYDATPPFDAITWEGDPEYLKERFVKFSYRFKFDDGEYSLIAPFTQTCFIPTQDGYFVDDDDTVTYKTSEVDFMKNKVNNITLIINSPTGNWSDISTNLKIQEVDIIYTESTQNVIKVVDTITSTQLALINSTFLSYNYTSSKPWKNLPEKEILRVYDQVPVRALGQEIAANRVIYGNYIDKPTPPTAINYSADVQEKDVNTQIEYQNQNLKQNRTYQVGVVLSDRYGRQSTVILSSLDANSISVSSAGSTIFHKFKESPFSDFDPTLSVPTQLFQSGVGPSTPGDVWDGDALRLTFYDTISSIRNSITGEPGLYDATTNPLGWYTYKIVVKQPQQDYYNVYFPGVLNGYIDGDGPSTGATASDPTGHFALAGDNINKVPRDLSLIDPTQKTFRSGRPSFQEDPSYYMFGTGGAGMPFSVDPSTVEGERLLKERDRERDLDSGSQITNSSVKLSLRLNNTVPFLGAPLTALDTTTRQAYPGTSLDLVTTIGTGQELGLWDPTAIAPYDTANVFFGFENNPYIAKTKLSVPTGASATGLTGPHPSAAELSFVCSQIGSTTAGTLYVAGSKNVPCTINTPSGLAISGFKVNIDAVTAGAPTSISVADIGTGWDSLGTPGATAFADCVIVGAGDGLCTFTLNRTYTAIDPVGKMAPSLAVYETEPLQSKLNIYWETSTNGLISELNTGVETGDITTPAGFEEVTGGGEVVYTQNESMNTSTDVTNSLYVNNIAGTALPTVGTGDIVTTTLLSVIDGNGTERKSEFTLEDSPGGVNNSFKLKTNAYFVCNADNNVRGSFTFHLNVEAPGSNYLTDGVLINRQLQLGPYNLTNTRPTFTTASPVPTQYVSAASGGLIYTFAGVNGSFVGGGLETEEVSFSLLSDHAGLFYLNDTAVAAGSTQLFANGAIGKRGGTIGTAYPIQISIHDGAGLSTRFLSFDVIFT
jgi:hypothetical protein